MDLRNLVLRVPKVKRRIPDRAQARPILGGGAGAFPSHRALVIRRRRGKLAEKWRQPALNSLGCRGSERNAQPFGLLCW